MKCPHWSTICFQVCILTILSANPIAAQTWLDFAHPHSPHLGLPNPDVYISIPRLCVPDEVVVQRPTLLVLMDWSDMTHRAVHTAQFWRDLVFADPPVPGEMSLRQVYHENSNGRFWLVPAIAGDAYDGSIDGVIGWRASSQAAQTYTDPSMKRAEGIRVADAQFDYWRYDTNNDRLITTDELLIIVVFADNATSFNQPTEDQHPGHAQLPNSVPRPGGNTRATNPSQVDVDAGTGHPVKVYQYIAGVGEIAHLGVVAHEIGHSTLGLGDLYEIDRSTAGWQQVSDGYTVFGGWYPPPPGIYSLMDYYFENHTAHLDPWAKIHLGMIKPMVLRHDGTYTLHDAAPERMFITQDREPEALIICDPRRSSGLGEYFILENRNEPQLPDRGLAVWLINENPFDSRKMVRLIRRGGHWAGDGDALWDGTDATQGYDLTMTSAPRNTSWTNGTPSGIEITDISPAAPAMTLHVRLPSIFVNLTAMGLQDGTADHPYKSIPQALAAIVEPPRTLRIAAGNYTGAMTITTPCTLMPGGAGTAVIGGSP